MPILTIAAIKGLIGLGEIIASHGLGAKVAYILMKAVSVYGLSTTTTAVLVTGVVAGKVLWTRDIVDNLISGYNALGDKNVEKAIRKFAKVAISCHIGVDELPNAVHNYLLKANFSEEQAKVAAKILRELEVPIANEIDRRKSK